MTIALYIIIMMVIMYTSVRIGNAALVAHRGRPLLESKVHGIPKSEFNALSWPARQVVDKFYALPENNRPRVDVIRVVRALDVKAGGSEHVTSAFGKRQRSDRYNGYDWDYETVYNWGNHSRHGDHCTMCEYATLYVGMTDIEKALERQARELELAGIEGDLSEVQSMIEAMKEEKSIIHSVTSQLTMKETN